MKAPALHTTEILPVSLAQDSPVTVTVGPVYCTFSSDVSEEFRQTLYSELAFHPSGYFYSPKYQSGVWDGYKHLYQPHYNRFRRGLLSRVMQLLEKHEVEVKLHGLPPSAMFTQHSTTYALRPHQLRAMPFLLGERFGIIQAPMRSGKTFMFIAAVDSERKFPAVFFCRSLDLARQTVERVRQYLPDVSAGLVGDGDCDIKDVTVVTIQSAFSAYNKKYEEKGLYEEKPLLNKMAVKLLLRNAQIVFYDEVHHSSATTSRFVLEKCSSATLKIGLSATPFSGDPEDLLVEEAVGPVIHVVGFSELIRDGFLLRPTIYAYKLPPVPCTTGSYQAVYKQAVVQNDFLNALLLKLVRALTAKGKSVVIQTEFVKHSRDLAKYLGVPVTTGKDTSAYRAEVKQKLDSKEILCLVSTLFEEGLDVPTLDYTINLAGGLADISTLQRMRSLTAAEGKTSCGVIDFIHQCRYLDRHSRVRLNAYRSESEFVVVERDVSNLSVETI